MMNVLAHRRKKVGKDMILNNQLNVSILFNQSIFKRKLSYVFTNEFVMSNDTKKEARVTQSNDTQDQMMKSLLELRTQLDALSLEFSLSFQGVYT